MAKKLPQKPLLEKPKTPGTKKKSVPTKPKSKKAAGDDDFDSNLSDDDLDFDRFDDDDDDF